MMYRGFRRWLYIVCLISVYCIYIPVSAANSLYSDTITISDAAGSTLHLRRPVERIVVVGKAPYIPLHILYMFPETRRVLAGYERKIKTDETFLSIIDSNYQKKTVLEANPGPEQIASLHPDLVVTKEAASGTLDRSMQVLGIPVIHLGVENPAQFLKDVEVIGTVLNNEKRAAEIVTYYNSRLNMIRKVLEGVSLQKRPRVLTLEYSDRGGSVSVKVPARSWIQTIQAQTAGGAPVWLDHAQVRDGWQIVGFEQIAAWNPDKIFMIVWYQMNGAEVIRSLKNDDKWKMLKAVSGNQFYLFPEDIFGWDTPDPRWILGTLWLAGKIHPDRFGAMNMKQEIYDFFQLLYAMDKSLVDTYIMPRVGIDAAK